MFGKRSAYNVELLQQDINEANWESLALKLKDLNTQLKDSASANRIFDQVAEPLIEFAGVAPISIVVDDSNVLYALASVLDHDVSRVVPRLVTNILGPDPDKRDSSASVLQMLKTFHATWPNGLTELYSNALATVLNGPYQSPSKSIQNAAGAMGISKTD